MTDDLVTPAELAARLKLSRRSLRRRLASGVIPPPDVRIGRAIRWRESTIARWLEEDREPQPPWSWDKFAQDGPPNMRLRDLAEFLGMAEASILYRLKNDPHFVQPLSRDPLIWLSESVFDWVDGPYGVCPRLS
jgi:excisionase family DNA binding protein